MSSTKASSCVADTPASAALPFNDGLIKTCKLQVQQQYAALLLLFSTLQKFTKYVLYIQSTLKLFDTIQAIKKLIENLVTTYYFCTIYLLKLKMIRQCQNDKNTEKDKSN